LCKRHASDCSSTLRGNNQALARQSFVLILDQIAVALSDFAALSRMGFEFIGGFFAVPAKLRDLPTPREVNIHGHPLRFRTVVLVSFNACGMNNVIFDNK